MLDVLHKVKWDQDGTLTFRRSCAHGVCGSDAMRINGRNRLACKILRRPAGPTRSPSSRMLGLPVIKDLVVDMEPFFDQVPRGHAVPGQRRPGRPTTERLQSPETRARYDDTHQVHPVRRLHDLVPAVLGADSSTSARRPSSTPTASSSTPATRRADERLEILNDADGVWRCRTVFNCTDACPRGIKITQAILEVSSAIVVKRA